jgi:hypothetical protein
MKYDSNKSLSAQLNKPTKQTKQTSKQKEKKKLDFLFSEI